MAYPSIVPASIEHIAHIAAHIRDSDREEIWASTMSRPERALASGLYYSDFAQTGMVDGEPVMMWGIVKESLIGNVGVPWMLATKRLDEVAVIFLRRCKAPLREAMNRYDRLFNYVDARNTRTIRWLKWLGFKLAEKPVPYGFSNLPFYKFEMVKEV